MQSLSKGSKLEWDLGLDLPAHLQDSTPCDSGSVCREWGDLARLEVTQKDICYEVKWRVDGLSSATDCFDLGEGFWFGGAEEKFQRFPMDNEDNKKLMVPFVPGDMLQVREGENTK